MYIESYIEENKIFFNTDTKIALFKLGSFISKIMDKMTLNEKSNFSINTLKGMDYRYINNEYILKKLFPKLTSMALEYDVDDSLLQEISDIIIKTQLKDLGEDDLDAIGYISLGKAMAPSFSGLISLKEASIMYSKEESTLRRNISNGKFKEGVDVKKFGNTWVFNIEAPEREYEKTL